MRHEDTIPLDECIQDGFYTLHSRHLGYGVFSKKHNGFIGIRTKFSERFLDMEFHWDTGEPYGTACPLEFLKMCDLEDTTIGTNEKVDGKITYKQNQKLFDWIEEKVKENE